MKKALLLVWAVLLLTACKKDSISNQSEYQKSYMAWMAYKQQVNNSYSYVVTFGSWTGFGTETVINVVNGKITNRNFTAFKLEATPQTGVTKTVLRSWKEDAATLNTHQPNEAAALLTLDEIYERAKNVWLAVDKKTNAVYFEAKNNGLISSCGFVPEGCQDDCFTGIKIASIGAAF